jgi:hypothetical protein
MKGNHWEPDLESKGGSKGPCLCCSWPVVIVQRRYCEQGCNNQLLASHFPVCLILTASCTYCRTPWTLWDIFMVDDLTDIQNHD